MSQLATLMIMTYNQSRYIRDAVRGALEQTYSPLEIILSDDCSTDDTYEIICAAVKDYRGPHKIIVRRNDVNMGVNRHVNEMTRVASGKFLLIGAGDDIPMPDRVRKSVERLSKGASGFFSNGAVIDERGEVMGLFRNPCFKHRDTWKEMLLHCEHNAFGFSLAWTRQVQDVFGIIPDDLLGEDSIIPFRCALLNGLDYISEPLVYYRQHDGNVSFWKSLRNAKSRTNRVAVGIKRARHRQKMFAHWKADIGVAFTARYITSDQYDEALQLVEGCLQIVHNQSTMLDMDLFAVLKQMRTLRVETKQQAVPGAFSKVIMNYLQYHQPGAYRVAAKLEKLYNK